MTITRAAAKAKGRSGEMSVLADLSNIIRAEYVRRLWPYPENGILRRGPNGKDLVGLRWLAPEIKRHEQCLDCNIEAWWSQAKAQAVGGAEPVLLWRPNHSPWRVRMFGRLDIGAGGAVRCPVDISYANFLLWFTHRLRFELDNAVKAQQNVAG